MAWKESMRLPPDDVPYVFIDGFIVDTERTLDVIARALSLRELEPSADSVQPPVTLGRVAGNLGLNKGETRELLRAIKNIPDFWRTLEPVESLPIIEPGTMLIAYRISGMGYSIARQTIHWLEKYGYNLSDYPVWVQEDNRK